MRYTAALDPDEAALHRDPDRRIGDQRGIIEGLLHGIGDVGVVQIGVGLLALAREETAGAALDPVVAFGVGFLFREIRPKRLRTVGKRVAHLEVRIVKPVAELIGVLLGKRASGGCDPKEGSQGKTQRVAAQTLATHPGHGSLGIHPGSLRACDAPVKAASFCLLNVTAGANIFAMKKKFKSKLVSRGPNGAWCFMPIPFDVEAAFGKKSRVAVTGSVNGFAFSSSLMPVGDGTHEMMFNKILQTGAKAGPGDEVEVIMEPDLEPRRVTLPEDFKKRLSANGASAKFAKLAYSHQKEYVRWIEDAKREETRERRIAKALDMIAANEVLSR